MKKMLVITFLYVVSSLFAHSVELKIMQNNGEIYTATYKNAQINLKAGDVDKALVFYAQAVKQAHERRNSGHGVDAELLAEYAYALALNHDFEAALINIDRARMLGTKYVDFYSAQILLLMGHTYASEQFMKHAKIPNWIGDVYIEFSRKCAVVTTINRDTPENALIRANKLAAQRQFIQAIALFEELKTLYPEVSIINVDYSTLWESLGYYGYAEQLLQAGINKMPSSIDENSKQVFVNHLSEVVALKDKYENASWLKRILGMEPPKMMAYVGTSVAKDFFSVNGRIGFYSSNKFSASVNYGLNYAGEQFSGTVGVSANKAWGIFVVGLGLSDQFGEKSNIFSFSPSVGLTFLNKSQTSSFDIMLNGYIPFSSNQKFSYSISIGKTIYFDLNRLLR